jgi:hypothetical protein
VYVKLCVSVGARGCIKVLVGQKHRYITSVYLQASANVASFTMNTGKTFYKTFFFKCLSAENLQRN